MIGAVISDLDGTLVDTAAANEAAYAEAFDRVGLAFDDEGYRAAFGLRFDEMVRRIAPLATLEDVAAVRSAKAERYPAHFELLRPNEALIALLETMRGSGLGVALATTAARVNVHAVLTALGLDGLFDIVVTGEDVQRGKPAPDCYLRAAELLGRAPSDCLAVEDSAVGVAAALAAGCRVLQVSL